MIILIIINLKPYSNNTLILLILLKNFHLFHYFLVFHNESDLELFTLTN